MKPKEVKVFPKMNKSSPKKSFFSVFINIKLERSWFWKAMLKKGNLGPQRTEYA